MSSDRILRIARHVLFGLVLVFVFAGVFGWVAMQAWNAVIPGLTGLPAVDFTQAVAGLVLVRILTGRFTPHGRGRSWRRCRPGAAARHSAALYSEWWDSEGEPSFQAFVARHMGEEGRG